MWVFGQALKTNSCVINMFININVLLLSEKISLTQLNTASSVTCLRYLQTAHHSFMKQCVKILTLMVMQYRNNFVSALSTFDIFMASE